MLTANPVCEPNAKGLMTFIRTTGGDGQGGCCDDSMALGDDGLGVGTSTVDLCGAQRNTS
jgi:hypothetical protein